MKKFSSFIEKSWAQQAAIAIAKKKSGKYDKDGNKLKEALDVIQRKKRAQLMKRMAPRIAIARAKKMQKPADTKQLQKRAQMAAKNILRKKVAGEKGANYAELSPQQKIAVDKMVDKKASAIPKIAMKLLPKIKAMEKERIKKLRNPNPE